MIAALTRFFLSGEYTRRQNHKLIDCLKLVLIGIGIHFLFSIIKVFLNLKGLVEVKRHPAAGIISDAESYNALLIMFFLVVILHPLIEELSFRLILNPKRRNLFFGSGFLVSYVILLFSNVHKVIPINREVSFDLLFIVIGSLGALGLFYISKIISIDFSDFVKNRTALFVFITSLLFAISHFFVIGRTDFYILYVPLLLPYFLKGYILAYARLSLGFGYAVLCHSLNNLFFFALNAFF